MQSLLPYLKTENSASHLTICRVPSQHPHSEQPHFPFETIVDSGSFTRIINARIESDCGSTIKNVFLLLDKDDRIPRNENAAGLNNVLVEQCWKRAYEQTEKDGSAIFLAGQTDSGGRIRLFQSLFYCRQQEVFFHPVCPDCGSPLVLCTDDSLLQSCGLQAYTPSHTRYLYCRECLNKSGHSDFYAPTLSNTDPDIVKDLHQLIAGFESLNAIEQEPLPCTACPHKGECYDNAGLAFTRIVPFSFYPFHLLIMESATINASDFLALLSGASSGDISQQLRAAGQIGRIPLMERVALYASQTSPFLFENDQRSFLEVLFLKLSFLGQLARMVFEPTSLTGNPCIGLSLDRIWVNLTYEENLLPFFWNFQAGLMDIEEGSLDLLPASPASIMGHLWFHVLLGNRALDISGIRSMLSRGMQRIDALTTTFDETIVMDEYSHLLGPENIFWNPEGETLPEEFSSLWHDALGLGWALLKNNSTSEFPLSENDFWKRFEDLRGEIKDMLFQSGPVPKARKADTASHAAIHETLLRIAAKWSSQISAADDATQETVVLSPDSASLARTEQVFDPEQEKTIVVRAAQPAPDVPIETSHGYEEDMPQTVILSGNEVPPAHPHGEDDDLEETIMMKPGHDAPIKTDSHPQGNDITKPQPKAQTGSEEDLDETVILSSAHSPAAGSPTPESVANRDIPMQQPSHHLSEPCGDEDIDQTVILGGDDIDQTVILSAEDNADVTPHPQGTVSQPESIDEEDFMTETIILTPDDDKA